MKPMFILVLPPIILSLSLFSPAVMAKKAQCDKYKAKMEKYQQLQRTGNSVKRSNKLKAQELKQFKNWQRCKQGKKVNS